MREVKDPEILKLFKETTESTGNKSLLDKISGYAGKFNEAVEASRLPSIAGGFLQGAGDIAASIANIPASLRTKHESDYFGEMPKVPHPHLEKYIPQDPISKTAFLGGELGANIPGWLGIQSKISKLMPGSQGAKRIGKEALAGATTGYALGEEMPGGRLASAALGSIVPPTTGLRSSKISENIAEHRGQITKEYSKKYEDLFKKAKEEGLSEIKLPTVNYDLLQSNIPTKQFRSIRQLQNNPTIENAHRAQSDLGKFISNNKNKQLDSETNKAIKEAIIAQKKLKGKIHTELSNVKGLSNEYHKITKGYGEEVVPYRYNKDISKFIEGKMKPSNLVGKLTKNDEFMLKQASKHPELYLQALLRSPLGKFGLGAGAAAIGAPVAYHHFSG